MSYLAAAHTECLCHTRLHGPSAPINSTSTQNELQRRRLVVAAGPPRGGGELQVTYQKHWRCGRSGLHLNQKTPGEVSCTTERIALCCGQSRQPPKLTAVCRGRRRRTSWVRRESCSAQLNYTPAVTMLGSTTLHLGPSFLPPTFAPALLPLLLGARGVATTVAIFFVRYNRGKQQMRRQRPWPPDPEEAKPWRPPCRDNTSPWPA